MVLEASDDDQSFQRMLGIPIHQGRNLLQSVHNSVFNNSSCMKIMVRDVPIIGCFAVIRKGPGLIRTEIWRVKSVVAEKSASINNCSSF